MCSSVSRTSGLAVSVGYQSVSGRSARIGPQAARYRSAAVRPVSRMSSLWVTPAEIALARIYLKDVDERIRLSLASRSSEQATKRRIAATEAENRRLRNELADAEGKLEAITSIERSIREREQ